MQAEFGRFFSVSRPRIALAGHSGQVLECAWRPGRSCFNRNICRFSEDVLMATMRSKAHFPGLPYRAYAAGADGGKDFASETDYRAWGNPGANGQIRPWSTTNPGLPRWRRDPCPSPSPGPRSPATTLTGVLRAQVCDHESCYRPGKITVAASLKVK
jgi:hypothetical protein